MEERELLLAIQALLDGTAWDSQTTSDIAGLMIASGYRIRDKHDVDLTEDDLK